MKKLFLTCAVVLSATVLIAQNTIDTSFIKRPFYLGVTYSAAKFLSPAYIKGVPVDNREEIYSGQSVGVVFSFPFLRRWDMETDFEFTTWSGWKNSHGSYMLPMSNPAVTWEQWSSHATRRNLYMLRMIGSYQLFQSEKFTVQTGLGGRLAMFEHTNWVPGNLMGEAGVNVIYHRFRHDAVQLGAWFGKSQYGEYITIRVAYCLKGTRTYRERPFHYYVRTYEHGE